MRWRKIIFDFRDFLRWNLSERKIVKDFEYWEKNNKIVGIYCKKDWYWLLFYEFLKIGIKIWEN